MLYLSAIDKNKHFSHLWSLWLWMGGVRQHWGAWLLQTTGRGLSLTVQWAEFRSEVCVFAHSGQVLLAEPEERRSFMDIRLLLARGDIGEAKSLPSTCIAGLSASWLSRHEPVGEGWGGGRRKDRDQRGHIHTLNSSTSQMWHLITGLHLAWVCKLEYEIHIGLKWGK